MSYSISLYTHQVFLFCSNYRTTRLSRYLNKTTHARNTQFEVKNKMAVSLGNFVKGNNSVKALKDYFKNISFKMSLEMLIWSVWSKIIKGIFKKSSFNNILYQKSFFFKIVNLYSCSFVILSTAVELSFLAQPKIQRRQRHFVFVSRVIKVK